MKKRVLWLFNHTSLRKFEVPLLIELGYEVFCPKICDIEFGDYSVSISDKYDSSLSIPEDVIAHLNSINFYKPISLEDMDLINCYFDVVFCLFHIPSLDYLATHFKGILFLHVFGLANGATYTDIILEECGVSLLEKLNRMGNRFWFAQTYDNLAEIECDLFKRRSVFLPIGLNISNADNPTWTGGDSKFLFVSPKIRTNDYYTKVYEQFKENFKGFDYVIGGAQPQKVVLDDTVTGFLSSDEYVYNMNHLSAMFYHSTEKRHLHYHPIEAIGYGMPLIFMAGGMLDHLGGMNLPGRCTSIKEARRKIRRLCNGDLRYAQEICDSQKILLEPFLIDNCKRYWINSFKNIEIYKIKKEEKRKIAVILPAAYTGGVLDYSIRLALCLNNQFKKNNDNFELIFAHPYDDVYKDTTYFESLVAEKIVIRQYYYESRDAFWLKTFLDLKGFLSSNNLAYITSNFVYLNDGISGFSDCEYAIITADSNSSGLPFFLPIPYAIVAHDYIQRFVPGVMPTSSDDLKLLNQRMADSIFVTSLPCYLDAIIHAGIEERKIELTPHLYDVETDAVDRKSVAEILSNEKISDEMCYFIWPTNTTPHKNHINALKAIEKYYMDGGTFDCIITGTNTLAFKFEKEEFDTFNSTPYTEKVRTTIKNSSFLSEHVHVLGELPKSIYKKILSGAKFAFHPVYGDNGSYCVIECASFSVPSVVCDYPNMRYLVENVGINVKYTSPFNVTKMSNDLLEMEKEFDTYASNLPSVAELKRGAYMHKGGELYRVIKKRVGG